MRDVMAHTRSMRKSDRKKEMKSAPVEDTSKWQDEVKRS